MGWSEYNGSKATKKWGTCADCKKHKRVESHHIIPKSQGGVETVDLCPRCHKRRHITKEDFVKWGSKGGKTTAANPANYRRNLKQFKDQWAEFPARSDPNEKI